MDREWLGKAAVLWVDMKRGVYPWKGKVPKNGDGSFRIVKRQILTDCGVTPEYSDANRRIWKSPEFEKLVADEEDRRDLGVAGAIERMNAVVGPLTELTNGKARGHLKAIFERVPDEEDPLALSPAQFAKEYREYLRLAMEVEGKLDVAKQDGIAEVLTDLASDRKITSRMLDTAMDLIAEFRRQQDERLAGVIDGELTSIDA